MFFPDQTRELQDKTREPTRATISKTREPILDPILVKTSPIDYSFQISTRSIVCDDHSITSIKRKKARLTTLHESLEHFIFSCLKLLDWAGIIPMDLVSIEPPVSPGYAYGKVHRLPWCYKVIHITRTLKIATTPGGLVSAHR